MSMGCTLLIVCIGLNVSVVGSMLVSTIKIIRG